MSDTSLIVPVVFTPPPEAVAAPRRRMPRRTKFFYGLGAVAYGVRDTSFGSFVLLFYNQVLGLPAAMAGLALALTLVADAVLDPLIGLVSDGWRSRWGRRHPFLYAAILPAALAHYFLWNPPAALSGNAVFWYLLAIAIAVRFCISLFEVPYAALVAEFTTDYDDRTSLLTYLFVFGWWGGLSLAVAAYALFFRPEAGDPSGMLGRHGFATYGLVASLVLAASMLIAGLGTQGEIPHLARPAASQNNLATAFADLRALFANRSVTALLISVLLLSTSQGFGNALYNYIQLFFWGLTSSQIGVLSLAPFVSAALALAAAPWAGRGREKRDVAIALVVVAVIGQPLPMLLRLAGLFPAPGSAWLLPLLTAHSAFETFVWVMFSIVSTSMVADLVEDNQRHTQRRTEGTLFALRIFAQKAVSGLGIFVSGLALAWIGFPAEAQPGHVAAPVLHGLALTYAPVLIVLGIASAAAMRGYKVTRARHAANVSAVAKLP
ncbi:MAG: MFS transporter [Rhizomicrobium sp.]